MDSVLHALGGAALGALGGFFGDWAGAASATALATGGGFAREWWQHRAEDLWISRHRAIEAVSWGIGALLGGIITAIVR
jgi:hypothetical protein